MFDSQGKAVVHVRGPPTHQGCCACVGFACESFGAPSWRLGVKSSKASGSTIVCIDYSIRPRGELSRWYRRREV